jgi:hypothetical protein
MTPPPILRGDLFALLEPDLGPAQLTPGRIGSGARKLLRAVKGGERSAGLAPLMALLGDMAQVRDDGDPVTAWQRLGHVRQNLKLFAFDNARPFPAALVSERTLIIPQAAPTEVIRVLPVGPERDVWFALTREVVPLGTESLLREYRFPEPGEAILDSGLGPPLMTPIEAAWRLFRFGERTFDIRAILRLAQLGEDYDTVHVATDGERIAVVATDRLAIFDTRGNSLMTSQLPFGRRAGEEAFVADIALDGDTLAMNLRQRPGAPFEIALIDLKNRRGFPVGSAGLTAASITLGPRQVYLTDEDRVTRLSLFDGEKSRSVEELALGPWFAEYPPTARMRAAFGAGSFWVSNGQKLLRVAQDLSHVEDELTLPEPILDFSVAGQELRLVHSDRTTATVRVAIWELEGEA